MVKQNNQLPLILLAIVLLFVVANIRTGTFLLYGGIELKNATISNETSECYTLGQDRCVRQTVYMLELESGLLICPEGYYPTQVDCQYRFGLIKVPKEEIPKVKCYYTQEDKCFVEEFDNQCPSQYFTSQSACEESLIDIGYHIKRLFTNKKTLIMIVIGLVALLVIAFNFFKRR